MVIIYCFLHEIELKLHVTCKKCGFKLCNSSEKKTYKEPAILSTSFYGTAVCLCRLTSVTYNVKTKPNPVIKAWRLKYLNIISSLL